MEAVRHTAADELRDDELHELILRRLRVGLGVVLPGVLISLIGDHLMMSGRPGWADLMDITAVGLVALAIWMTGRDFVRARPVPFTLAVVAVTCGMRAAAGVWFGDLAQTAILCVAVALTVGATIPWGVGPQLVTVAIAGSAIAANAYLIEGPLHDPLPHLAVGTGIALLVSVVLSIELQRYRRHLAEENAQRRRAELDLAQLNADLEQRVAQRTTELAAATQRLEREAVERTHATQELHASRRRLQDILDNAPAAIHLKDVDGRYLSVNRHWESIFGLRREDAVGKTLYDVFPAETADMLRANDTRVLEEGQALQVEETLAQADGLHTYVSVKFPLYDTGPAPVAVCGISTDITARKQMEAELRRSEAALSTLVENTTDSIWSVDRNGVLQAMNSVFRNRFRMRYGVDYARAVSEQRVPKPVWEDIFALYARAFQGEHVQVERVIPLDDEPHYFLLSVHPIVDGGEITGATVFSKDITEHKRVEKQARQHQADLAHVLRLGTMGEMAAGLAHEINQPLGAIANYAQGCVRRLRAGSTDAASLLPIVEEIALEALRAGEIIRRLRELVRKETPQQQLVDINALVRKSFHVVEPEARQHGITVELALSLALPPVSCDAIQIEQVLLNLMLNAIEAVQAAGNGERSLIVTTSAIGDAAVEVAIRDSGIGVPEPPVDVFAPFFSTKRQGLGMGLSISRSIIQAHGGHLSAARNADRGSTFRFVLPVTGEVGDATIVLAPERSAALG